MVPIFDSYGDLQIYSCKSEFNSYNLEESEFSKNNIKIAEEINMRTLQLENAFHTKSVYLRVPPIYVNSEEKLKAYTNLMNIHNSI